MMQRLPFSPDLPERFENLRVTVMGLGRFGGGVGVARFYAQRGANVTVTDLLDGDALRPQVESLADLDIRWMLGAHPDRIFTDTDILVVNPAVPNESRLVQLALQAGVRLEREFNLFVKLCPAPVVGITGSNGKTTTTGMITGILQETGQTVWEGGNIGRSLLPHLDQIQADHLVILEISSFQLEAAASLRWSPHVAIVTNCTPNHLDRYESFEAYAKAKQIILAHQKANDVAVINSDDPITDGWPTHPGVTRLTFGSKEHADAFLQDHHLHLALHGRTQTLLPVRDLQAPGPHMCFNALAAALAAGAMGVEISRIRAALRHFRPRRHRLEFAGRIGTVRFFNDSKATTPEAASAALNAFHDPTVLIAGGYDKKLSLEKMAESASKRAYGVVLIGETASQLADQIRVMNPACLIHRCRRLTDACQQALEIAPPGGVVLLSPGCASWDMFTDYEERGDIFCQWVRNHGMENI